MLAEYDSSDLVEGPRTCTAYVTRCQNTLPTGKVCNYIFDPPEKYLHSPDVCPRCNQPRQRCRSRVYHASAKEQGSPNYCWAHFKVARDPTLRHIFRIIDETQLGLFNDSMAYYEENHHVAPDLTRELSVSLGILYKGLEEEGIPKKQLELVKDYLSIVKQHKDIMEGTDYWKAQTQALLEQLKVEMRVREQAYFLFCLSGLFSPRTRTFEHIVEYMQLREPTVWNQVLITYEKLRQIDEQRKLQAEEEDQAIEGHADRIEPIQ